MNETCAPVPSEVSAKRGRWRASVQSHVSKVVETGRHWRDIVYKECPAPETYPRSLELEQGNCKTEDSDIQTSQRKIPIDALYPNTAAANRNVTPGAGIQITSNSVNCRYATDISSTIHEQRFTAEEHPSSEPLFTTHQGSLNDCYYKRLACEYPRAVQQPLSLKTYPLRNKTDPFCAAEDHGTNVYPCAKNNGGATEETSCTLLKNQVALSNCGAQLHGVSTSCDPAAPHHKPAHPFKADMDNEYYIESNMRERMQSMDFEPNAVSSQSSTLSALPQRSVTSRSDSYSSASPVSHRRQSSRRLESSAHKRCKSQSSLFRRSRSYSPLTSIPHSRSHHLLKRSRNSSQSSQSRSESFSIHSSPSSLSRSRPRCKSNRRLYRSSGSRRRSPSSTGISSRKAYHSTRVRSRRHYTPKRTSQSSRSSRPRSSRSSRPRSSRSSRPRSSRSSRPRSSRSSRPRSSRSSRPRSSRSSRSRSSRSSRSKNSRSSWSRSLTPHGKGRPSSREQKSSSNSSAENTTQRNFGVKVQFDNIHPIFDDKAVKDQIFRLFHKFGFVTYVMIINSYFGRYAIVYFSRLYEQLSAIKGSTDMTICGAPLHVSLWTGNEIYEQPKQDNAPPETPGAKLSPAINNVASYCDPNIFNGNNKAELHPSSSRTLLISKLPKSIAPEKLDRICEKFENILDVEVKQTPGEGTCSALVEFSDIVSLVNAGRVLNREFFGVEGVRVWFAERKPTNCMWVDGLPSGLQSAVLMAHFTVYGDIAKMLHDRLLCRALILYKRREDALFAVNQRRLRRGKVFGTCLMLDFASDMSQLAFCQSMQESGQDVGNFLHE